MSHLVLHASLCVCFQVSLSASIRTGIPFYRQVASTTDWKIFTLHLKHHGAHNSTYSTFASFSGPMFLYLTLAQQSLLAAPWSKFKQ